MLRILTALLVCAAAEAATLNVNLAINATMTATASGGYAASGSATLTGGITDSGTFSSTIDLTTITTTGAPYTLTLKNGILGGTMVIPDSALVGLLGGGTSASGISATVASATGSYAGDSGSFPSLSGSGGFNATGAITFTLSGAGTLTTGGTVTNPPPTITAVLDAASNTPNVAQGTIFIVKGKLLCPGSQLTEFSVPRPTTTPDGVQITFTPAAGGTGTNALLWYEDPGYDGTGTCQLAGILPSSVATGNYNVTVTSGTATSAPVTTQVLASKFAMFTQDSTGNGLAVAQNVVSTTEYDLNRLTTGTINGIKISPAYPGEYMVVYGTGLGGVAGDDNIPSPVYDFTKNGVTVQAIVGGTAIPALFAGRAGYAGEDQINFQLPANIATGCTVVLQISVNGVKSPATTISIANSASAGTCTLAGYSSSLLSSLDNGATINTGSFELTQISSSVEGETFTEASVGGSFTQLSGLELPSLATGGSTTVNTQTIGSCTVYTATFTGNNATQTPSAGGVSTNLDAGQVTISGPAVSNLSNSAMTDSAGAYSLTIGETGLGLTGGPTGTLGAGAYPITAAGGTGVKGFNTSITLGPPLTITGGLPTTVVRSNGMPLAWTGGNSTDVVSIQGFSGTSTGTEPNTTTTATVFTCTTTAGTGGFTVSSQVLDLLPATGSATSGGVGYLTVSSGPAPVPFTTSLTSSPSTTVQALYSAGVGTAGSVIYQ
ncbi:MAG TPA: hypothetical protein VMB03_16525 [Bryobacteraceae bacterium]|nr:hypothetical protein [Bryobacteraceae bacterium]